MQTLIFQKSGDIATDNSPSDQMPKIQGEFICSELEKNTRGYPYYFLRIISKVKKITKGYPYSYFENYIKSSNENYIDSFIF